MRERGGQVEFGEIIDQKVNSRIKTLIGPLIDYKEAVESGDAKKSFQTESWLRDIMPGFNKEEIDGLLRIKK